jgi:hypothetical protein
MLNDSIILDRVLQSYKVVLFCNLKRFISKNAHQTKKTQMMLDFYGIRLINETTGDVERADNFEERFDNLNRNTHNNLRISR